LPRVLRPAPILGSLALLAALALTAGACGREEDPFAGFETIPVTAPPPAPRTVPALTPEPPPPPPKPRRKRRPPPRARVSPDPLPEQGPVPPAPDAGDQRLPGNCCSEPRRGRQIDAIVLHTTETRDRDGFGELARLARYFVRVRRSSHVANDGEGYSSRMIDDDRVAYHATYWNVSTLGLEQVGFAAFGPRDWTRRPVQLESTARWIAHWAGKHRIPIRRCEVQGLRYNRHRRVVAGVIVKRGVCSHGQVDPRNRTDPGRSYPWDAVLRRARDIVDDAG
jgi:N-acetylmuramoyl-L-alanine amidase